jgi:hypothetical protein
MGETPQEKIERLAQYWDTRSAPAGGIYGQVDRPAADPIVVFSMRLPREVADQLRKAADARGMGPTELAREWIAERLSRPPGHSPAADAVAGQLEQLAAQLRAS